MSSQRRVTTPPEDQAEVVTGSLRSDSPGKQTGTEAPPGLSCVAPVSPHKDLTHDSDLGITRLCPGFLADLILPGVPGVGVFPL
jgi:hypothetical protein